MAEQYLRVVMEVALYPDGPLLLDQALITTQYSAWTLVYASDSRVKISQRPSKNLNGHLVLYNFVPSSL